MSPHYGFPKSARLLRSAEFRRVQRGQRSRSRHLIFRAKRNEGDAARFGLAVSRKVGNAVTRNRVKRWIREAIRHERQDLKGMDIVVIALPHACNASASSIREQVAGFVTTLKRARSSR